MELLFWLGFFTLLLILMVIPRRETGCDRCMWWHSIYGKYEVHYYDGGVTQPLTKEVAEDYAKIFGGTVHRIQSFHEKENAK